MIEFLKIYFKAQVQLFLDMLYITKKIDRDITFAFNNDASFFDVMFYTDFYKGRKLSQFYILQGKSKSFFDEILLLIKNTMQKDAMSLDIFDPFSFSGKVYISNIINQFLANQTVTIKQDRDLYRAIIMIMNFYHLDSFFPDEICKASKQIVSKIDNFESFGKYVNNPRNELLIITQSMELLYNYIVENDDYAEFENKVIVRGDLKTDLKKSIIYQCALNLIDLNIEFIPTPTATRIDCFKNDISCYRLMSLLNSLLANVKSKHMIIYIIDLFLDKISLSSIYDEDLTLGVNLLKSVFLSKRSLKQKINDFFIRKFDENSIPKNILQFDILEFEKNNSAFSNMSDLYKKYYVNSLFSLEDIYSRLNVHENDIPADILEKAKNIFLGVDEEESDLLENNDMNFFNDLFLEDDR
jgi:hypothetical protein